MKEDSDRSKQLKRRTDFIGIPQVELEEKAFYWTMSSPHWDLSDAEYRAAVAAAAYAIQSMEESSGAIGDESLRESEGRAEDEGADLGFKALDDAPKSKRKVVTEKVSSSSSRKVSPDSQDDAPKSSLKEGSAVDGLREKAPSFRKSVSFADLSKNPETPAGKEKERKRGVSLKKPPSFENLKVKIPEAAATTRKAADDPPSAELLKPERQEKVKRAPEDSKAEAWEREEMASIKERYQKLTSTIDEWENKKKKTANRKLEKLEGEWDQKRVRELQGYRTELRRIEEIARGARARAEDNRRKEELKVKQKANKIRLTGKIPPTCFFCF